MPRFRVTIPATLIPRAVRSLQNAVGRQASDLAGYLKWVDEAAGDERARVVHQESADTCRARMSQLEEALSQLGWEKRRVSHADRVLDSEDDVIYLILVDVFAEASRSADAAMLEEEGGEFLTDGRLPDLARMLTSVHRSTSRRSSTSRKGSA